MFFNNEIKINFDVKLILNSENKLKRKIFFIILAITFFLYGSYTTLDWTLYFFNIAPFVQPEIPYTRITKVSSAFLCAILAWIAGSDGINKQDTKKIRIVFLSIAIGEIIFLMDIYILGVISFGLTQILLIWRNGQGFKEYNQTEDLRKRLLLSIILAAVITFVMIFLFVLIVYPYLKGSFLFYIIIVYAVLLGISLWTAWMSRYVKFFPRKNAFLIALGMTFFFTADFLVGLNLSLPIGNERIITHYLTWIFYFPALLLLALSSYKWKEK